MNFYAFEYEINPDFYSINFNDTSHAQAIKENPYFFLHKKFYTDDYADDWEDENKNETLTGKVGGLKQLNIQVFILIHYELKHIYSSLDSVNKTKNLIEELLNVKLNASLRLVSIEDFEKKIKKLTSISIKTQSLKQKAIFTENFLNVDNQIMDLSDAEDFKLEIGYNLSTSEKKIVKMYKELIEKYNVGEVVFKGSNDDDIFQFNKNSIVHKIPISLPKNGEGNIFDYREVFDLLTKQL